MKTKYITVFKKIIRIEIEKETKSFYWIKGENHKRSKDGYKKLHETFEDAKQYILELNQKEIDCLKNDIKQLEEDRKRIESLTENDI